MATTFINNVPDANAIEGNSVAGRGVVGRSTNDYGMRAHSVKIAGIRASSDNGNGAEGWAIKGTGVSGTSKEGNGVWGNSDGANNGVVGTSVAGAGVTGDSKLGDGVRGVSHSEHAGVVGMNEFVQRVTPGLVDRVAGGPGVYGESRSGEGVRGVSHSAIHGAVVGFNNHAQGIAIYGKGGRLAALFDGDVEVKGDIRFLSQHGDCAEDFDIAEAAEPGTVMVLGEAGALRQSSREYDKRVAGVISGAGSYKPALVLDKQESETNRVPIGLVGKVYCKVDAAASSIEIGDLLTTSSTPGHAMKASDPLKAFGSVIGKALQGLQEGQGLIPILIALQ
jgi:hypothetical protein